MGETSDIVQITVSGNYGGQKLRKIVNNENPALLVPLYGKSPESLVMENGDTLLGDGKPCLTISSLMLLCSFIQVESVERIILKNFMKTK